MGSSGVCIFLSTPSGVGIGDAENESESRLARRRAAGDGWSGGGRRGAGSVSARAFGRRRATARLLQETVDGGLGQVASARSRADGRARGCGRGRRGEHRQTSGDTLLAEGLVVRERGGGVGGHDFDAAGGQGDWNGLDWTGLDWTGLDWIGLDWIGLGWQYAR